MTAPQWVLDGEPEPPVLWAVIWLDEVDVVLGQMWHDLAEKALAPMIRPAGAPAYRRTYQGFLTNGTRPARPRSWSKVMLPSLTMAFASWNYGDAPAHGPVESAGIGAFRHEVDGPFMQLEIRARVGDPDVVPEVAGLLVDVVRQIVDRIAVAYGEMCDHALLRPSTNLDRALRRTARDSMAASHRFLRGYEWVTVCPAAVATSLGGAAAMRATGAFAEVTELAAGGLLLRATRTPLDYDDAALHRVFTALRPALPPGVPRHLEVGTIPHLVMLDAAGDGEHLGGQRGRGAAQP